MPDQSAQYQSSPEAAQARSEPGNPADTSGNDPSQAQPSAVAANAPQASEGQKTQADAALNRDPKITETSTDNTGLTGAAGPDDSADSGDTGASDDYDDEDAWSYRDLQHEAKSRDLSGQGTREELVARLREDDANRSSGDGGGGGGGGTASASSTGDDSGQLSGTTADENSGAEMVSPEPSTDVPSGEVDPSAVENGGIQRTDFGTDHASVLQGLSNDRRAQQLASVKEQAERQNSDA